MAIEIAANIADALVSPQYRQAVNEAFEQSPEEYDGQRQLAQEMIFGLAKKYRDEKERAWEGHRLATLDAAQEQQLGPFTQYFQYQNGDSKPAKLTVEDLEDGEARIVSTNSRIISVEQSYDEPIDFLKDALQVIRSRAKLGESYVGPENYATTLKFFADKYGTFPSQNLDRATTQTLIDEAMHGFVAVAQNDKPNFVEMTNIYYAIRNLPADMFKEEFTRPLLIHTLEQMPTYNRKTLSLALAVMSKLDLSKNGEVAANVIDLVLRKNNRFETTRDLRVALAAVANLSPSVAADRAFNTLVRVRNDVEKALDIEGAEAVSSLLLRITHDVIRHPGLSDIARNLSRDCMVQAATSFRQRSYLGDLTKEQKVQAKKSVDRIRANFQKM